MHRKLQKEPCQQSNDVMHAGYYWCFISMTTRLNGVFQVCKVEKEVTVSRSGNSDKIPLDPVSQFGSLWVKRQWWWTPILLPTVQGIWLLFLHCQPLCCTAIKTFLAGSAVMASTVSMSLGYSEGFVSQACSMFTVVSAMWVLRTEHRSSGREEASVLDC